MGPRKKSVLVIGGGISGLAAAWELIQNSFSVTLIEAKNRLGGRILTINNPSLPIELGAEFVHGQDPALLDSIHAAGLSIQETQGGDLIWKNNKLEPTDFWPTVSEVIGRINPRTPDASIRDFLGGLNLDEQTRTMFSSFVEGFEAAQMERISTHSLLRAQVAADHMGGGRQFRVSQGYSALIHYFGHKISDHGGMFITGATARQIRYNGSGVEVTLKKGDAHEILAADMAVITLPLGVLKRGTVLFDPPLRDKQIAIQELEFGNARRITFHFREKWWPVSEFIHAPDEALTAWWDDSRGPLLTGWAGGPKADDLVELSSEALETKGVEILGKIFDARPSFVRQQLIASHTLNWARASDILGAYSYIPVNGLDLPRLLGAPVADRLFFAGEATVTDAQTGTVFGALETGLRAAREVRNCRS